MSVGSPDFKELIIKLARNSTKQNWAINSKASGTFSTLEDLSGKTYIINGVNKGSYFKVVSFGALPGISATKTVAHGIPFDASYKIIDVYGGSTNPATLSYLPLPFPHPTVAQIISLQADGTNVIVTTGATDYSAWTDTIIIIEYLKY